ncbi:MAG: Ig-like domain-containing protein, partial [Rhodothermales bacterium]|nr:Ig-like domain-containing protein [Rhodothermales bacterium]
QAFLEGVARREHSGHLSVEQAEAFRDAVAGIQLALDLLGGQHITGAVSDSSTIPVGFDINFFPIATFGDGSTDDISASVNWQSSDAAVASIDASGHAIGQSAGVATIAAEDPASGLVATHTLTIVDYELTEILVTPNSPSVPVGLTTCLQATAQYSDAGTWVATHLVTWSSGDPSVADLEEVPGSEGCVTGNALGVSTITATLSGVSGSTDLTVTDPVPVALTVTPDDAAVQLDLGTLQYTALGFLSDGSSLDLTSFVEWSVSDPSVATISGDGLATLLSPGATNVFAIYEGSINDNTQLTVF